MQSFNPYTIEHIQTENLFDFFTVAQRYYLLIWWKNLPLGHLWIDDIEGNDRLLAKSLNAIEGTIDYYSHISGTAHSKWRQYLLEGNAEKFNEELDKILPCIERKPAEKKLSVVICTRNRPRDIEKCILSLLASIDKDFEIVVVDNAPSDDSTEKILLKYPTVKYLKEPRKGLDIARNAGARNASGEIIAYTDDDVTVSKDWTINLKRLFKDDNTMAITGLVIPISLSTLAEYIFEKDWGFNKGYIPLFFDSKYFAAYKDQGVPVWDIGAGANMAFRKEIFDIIGWFDERLDVGASGCSGDSEFWYRILAEGFWCQYHPELVVYHKHREDLKALKSQIFNYMRGQVSSILVQYEVYHHRGNLHRLRHILPIYYLKKLFVSVINFRWNTLFGTFNEIKGCISGWMYYNRNRNVIRKNGILYLKSLDLPVKSATESLVTIIIPCHNHAAYLRTSIESALNQTHNRVEIVVIDDGSTDNTPDVCKAYKNVKYVYTNQLGLSGARNLGISHAQGKFLVFLDADDYLFQDGLALNLKYFNENPEVAFISGAHCRVDNNGNLLDTKSQQVRWAENYIGLLNGNYIAMEGAVMYRKDLFYTFLFDPLLKACEDYDINLKITRHFKSITHDKKIAAYRIHENNMSAEKSLMLKNSIDVLSRQKKHLRTQDEFYAYESGIKNWQEYYKS